jgi:hypothetical protein
MAASSDKPTPSAAPPARRAEGKKKRKRKKGIPPGPAEAAPAEIGGPKGPEPTRYGDWERKGRCSDF